MGAEGLHSRQRLDLRHSEQLDFRGPESSPGSRGQYADVPLHAGLVCINGPDEMKAVAQAALFGAVLDVIGFEGFLNEAIEITLAEDNQQYEIKRYALFG